MALKKQQQRFWFNVCLALAVLLVMSFAPFCSCTEEGVEYEEAKDKAAEASKEASESWAGWAKDKISDGFGLKGEEAKETSDSTAKNTKEKVQDVTSGVGQYSTEKAGNVKDAAGDLTNKAKEKVGTPTNKAVSDEEL